MIRQGLVEGTIFERIFIWSFGGPIEDTVFHPHTRAPFGYGAANRIRASSSPLPSMQGQGARMHILDWSLRKGRSVSITAVARKRKTMLETSQRRAPFRMALLPSSRKASGASDLALRGPPFSRCPRLQADFQAPTTESSPRFGSLGTSACRMPCRRIDEPQQYYYFAVRSVVLFC